MTGKRGARSEVGMVSEENSEPAGDSSHETPASTAPRRIPWRQHAAWLDHNWHPGMHVSIVVATGGGKSYMVRHGLLPHWEDYRDLIFDVKGDDPTLVGLGQVVHGYPEQERNNRPPADQPDRIYRLLVPEWEFDPRKRSTAGLDKARLVAGTAIDQAYKAGDWLLVLDETRAFTDGANDFGLGLGGVIENIWQRGRSRRVTLIACTQQPIWMPSSFYTQPKLIYIGAEVEATNEHLRDIGGNRELIKATIPTLGEHEFLCISRTPRAMWIVKVGR